MSRTAEQWLQALRELGVDEPVRIMNVCGGHERSISMAGLRTAIPENIELVPGPGCPVCICPEEDVFEAIQLALHEDVILVAFGDMLRVPVNVPKREPRSLEQAKVAGADKADDALLKMATIYDQRLKDSQAAMTTWLEIVRQFNDADQICLTTQTPAVDETRAG